MPRILLNTTVINKGGALQTSSNFLAYILRQPTEFEWELALSPQVASAAESLGVAFSRSPRIFANSPARDSAARRDLRAFADEVRPDAVFTFSGPAYVAFGQPHLLGCSEPWVTHAGLAAYRSLDFPREWFSFGLTTLYKMWWVRRANRWVMQTEASRQGLHRRLGIPLEKIDVISNSCGAVYYAHRDAARPFPRSDRRLRIFCFSAPYKHKNLQVLPRIAAELKRIMPERSFEIVLTLPPDGPDWQNLQSAAAALNVADRLTNHGPIPVSQGPELFSQCDFLLLPTVLETFSATYPESMAMGLPIVTSDLDFARDICGPAALYFPPRDANAAVGQIVKLLRDEALWNSLVQAGKERLKNFPEPGERSEAYLDVLRKLLAETRP
ncbi:MAG: glycosyltransferase [Pirellulales bacterium]|nr:glycosyltransferase [Pirellulales bacterium]